jgi:hypothetical protein
MSLNRPGPFQFDVSEAQLAAGVTWNPVTIEQPIAVHLVLLPDRSSLFGAWLDEETAHNHAKSINGVVAAIPLSGDYRKTSGD